MRRFIYIFSILGDYGFIWVVIAVFKAVLIKDKKLIIFFKLALSGVLSISLTEFLKMLFKRPRPRRIVQDPIPLRYPASYSFPSGQALTAFLSAELLSDSIVEQRLYLLIASFIAFSRIYSARHHSSDVMAGSLIGYSFGKLLKRSLKVN